MILLLKIGCVLSLWGLLHSYLIYPLLVKGWASRKKENQLRFQQGEALPLVSVIMAVYNEEQVIEEKMQSLLTLDYPMDRLKIFVGSDCSSDASNSILTRLAGKYPNIYFSPFPNRRGKPGVVNELVEQAGQEAPLSADHLFLLTDANVILQEDTLFQLVQHFKNPKIALVDANMIPIGMRKEGISKVENQYVSNEVRLKNAEGIAFGKMIGPFGGCYVLRSNYFSPVPDRFLVDDFYIAMCMFEKGGDAINELKALCYESISHDLNEEYRRKSRISAGNFQNLRTFQHILWKGSKLSFAFFSHKVLRWLGPFFIIFVLLSSGILAISGNFNFLLLFLLAIAVLLLVPILDLLFRYFKIEVLAFRMIRYFVMMNIALLEGFFKYLKGIKNNVWQPPKRT